jgi:hypothetical protein
MIFKVLSERFLSRLEVNRKGQVKERQIVNSLIDSAHFTWTWGRHFGPATLGYHVLRTQNFWQKINS